MEVDTGSSLSLINRSTYDLIASHIQVLQKSKVKLKTYTGESVGILGTANVEVTYGETKLYMLLMERVQISWEGIGGVALN